ncbi:MAG: phage shock protein C [Cyclobacteriaceae bacterium]|jgi:phage shock protein C
MQKRLTRSKDGVLAGVCSGIAKYFDLDPSLVRIAYILASIVSVAFPGAIVYIILWFVIPEEY